MTGTILKFPTDRIRGEFVNLAPMLLQVVVYVLFIWTVPSLIVTSIRRTKAENEAAGARTQIHVVGPPYRAIDFRIWNLGGNYQAKALNLAKKINRRFIYDPRRPHLNVAFARAHGSGPHLHLQVHPRTRLRSVA